MGESAWPRRADGPMWKAPRAAAKAAQHRTRQQRRTTEDRHKDQARRRDLRRCRFPLCGCRRIGLALEVSHDRHKGAGGDPSGERSRPELLITFCVHRHQDSVISRHRGTLRTRYLTPAMNDGPLAFELRTSTLRKLFPGFSEEAALQGLRRLPTWFEVARERAVQVLEPLDPLQTMVLKRLAEMDR